jgi:hypothetical protein
MTQKSYILRTCDENLKSYNNFQWPSSGPVECPDWDPRASCGNGLHGLLNGEGDGTLLSWDPTAQWMVVEVDPADVVNLIGKVKFHRGVVIHVGDRQSATDLIQQLCPASRAVVGACSTAGDGDTATAGDSGTATAGNYGTATAGYKGTAVAGYRGTATAGDEGTATAGDGGTATAGDRGTATAGDEGTATAGNYGTATAGDGGIIRIRHWDGSRYRDVVGYIGEGDLKANAKYRLNENGVFVEVT